MFAARFWAKADSSSPAKWEQTTGWYRDYFWEEIIGKLPKQTESPNPRTRLLYDTPEVEGLRESRSIFTRMSSPHGILLLPKDLKPGEKRPVVVCQHGLEGRPPGCLQSKQADGLLQFIRAARLADLGYIVYAPQNPYIGNDKFRILIRKAHPLKLSLYSFIVRQHETATDWLASLPFVDPLDIGLPMAFLTAAKRPCACRPSSPTIACRSAPATSTSGSARTFRSTSGAVTSGRSNTTCTSSISARRSTMPRWPT